MIKKDAHCGRHTIIWTLPLRCFHRIQKRMLLYKNNIFVMSHNGLGKKQTKKKQNNFDRELSQMKCYCIWFQSSCLQFKKKSQHFENKVKTRKIYSIFMMHFEKRIKNFQNRAKMRKFFFTRFKNKVEKF